MQVNLNTQNNNSIGFKQFKKPIRCGYNFSSYVSDKDAIVEKLTAALEKNESFKRLSNKYDVFVNLEAFATHRMPEFTSTPGKDLGILLYKGLTIDILARKIGKRGLLEFFRKKPKPQLVTDSLVGGVEANTWNLADNLINLFINPTEEMAADINKFLTKAANK